MRNVTPDTLAVHSAEVATVTHALALIGNKYYNKNYDCGRAALLALYHDALEVYTGDLPTPVKYFSPSLRESYHEIERNAAQALISKLPEELRADFEPLLGIKQEDLELLAIVKAADKLCAYIKCVEEEKYGNNEFREAKKSVFATLESNNLPELKHFILEFLPAFSLTLDEL